MFFLRVMLFVFSAFIFGFGSSENTCGNTDLLEKYCQEAKGDIVKKSDKSTCIYMNKGNIHGAYNKQLFLNFFNVFLIL